MNETIAVSVAFSWIRAASMQLILFKHTEKLKWGPRCEAYSFRLVKTSLAFSEEKRRFTLEKHALAHPF